MTMQIILDVPDALIDLPEEEREALFRAGLREAASARARQLENEIAEAEAMIQRFERRYGMTFDRFENDRLQELSGLETHEDYNDWFYLTNVVAEKKKLILSLQQSKAA